MPIPEIPASSRNPLRGAVEIIPNCLYFCALKDKVETLQNQKIHVRNPHAPSFGSDPDQKFPVVCFRIDHELVYWNFYLDFGPLNLGQLWRFTHKLNGILRKAEKDGTIVLFYSSTFDTKRANAIFLICAWQVLELNRSPEDAILGFSAAAYHQQQQNGNKSNNNNTYANTNNVYAMNTHANNNNNTNRSSSRPPLLPLSAIGAQTIDRLPPFHDASPYKCHYHLTLRDCLAALVKARQFRFFDWGDRFDVKEYEHFEQVENGDLNWIVKDKILAFAGPSFVKTVSPEGYCTLSPNDYIPYFKRKNIGLVVRLNQKNYEETQFTNAGMDHYEEVYTDGSCPHMDTLRKVVASFERVVATQNKGFAVHCKAGLGRTGTCIGAYLMKHYRMTAKEVIGWMRICRPGMVIGPQQEFLEQIQPIMWYEGDAMRAVANSSSLSLSLQPTSMSMSASVSCSSPHLLPSLAPRHKHGNKYGNNNSHVQLHSQLHLQSPSSRLMSTSSISTVTTAPESPSSVVLTTANSHEMGHEVILGGSAGYVDGSNNNLLQQQQLQHQHQSENNPYEREMREGRPGQADGLLAARQQNHHREHVTATPQSPLVLDQSQSSNNNDGNAAMPVTPDARATPSESSSSSSSIWGRAFA